jgi:hypothetical protein
VLLTTEKDLVRLAGDPALESLARRARALPVRLEVVEAESFRRFVLERLAVTRSGDVPWGRHGSGCGK